MGIITGDFVFVGDVGRPDLLERAAGVANTMEAGAHALFHSLEKFRGLPDHLQVWQGGKAVPGVHGQGMPSSRTGGSHGGGFRSSLLWSVPMLPPKECS